MDLYYLAKQRLKALLVLDGNNERIYFNLAMLSMFDKNYLDAERWFKETLRIKADFHGANYNLALLLAETKRPLDALPYLEHLLAHRPDHIKGLTLLGDILINHVKNFDKAGDCYLRILKLQPNNIQARHNLCVVYVEKNLLDKAEQCLDEAKRIAPNQNYIDRHLKIVKLRIIKKRTQLKN